MKAPLTQTALALSTLLIIGCGTDTGSQTDGSGSFSSGAVSSAGSQSVPLGSSSISHAVSSASTTSKSASSETGCSYLLESGGTAVTTLQGALRGVRSHDAYAFLGIPYAAPPVGARRWQAPEPPECRAEPLDADAYKSACPQVKFEPGDSVGQYAGDEDCLYLNVFKPVSPRTDSLPVMIFIHGGGNTQGSASLISNGARIYDGSYLAGGGDAVTVTINYRLGALGWLVHPALEQNGTSGNYGLQDQIMALHWIRDNIAAFGGDPENIMIFGESGGGVDVCALMTSPRAEGLFTRAAIESGGCVAADYAQRLAEGERFADDMNCSGTPDVHQCLMQTPAQTLVSTLSAPFQNGIVTTAFGPTVNGAQLTQHPYQALLDGAYNHVPLLIGTNRDETASVIAPGSITPAGFTLLLKATLPSAMLDEALALYPPGETNSEARSAMIAFTSDSQFHCPARRNALAAALHGDPVWRYLFDHAPDTFSGDFYGAVHGLELFYVFNTYVDALSAFVVTEDDHAVGALMANAWRRFADTGDPNGGNDPNWPRYSSEDPYLRIAAEPGSATGYRQSQCNFWDRVIASGDD